MQQVLTTGKSLLSVVLALLYPPRCPACSAPSSAVGNLCGTCAAQIRTIAAPHCQCCGSPFAYAMEMELCALCAHQRPPYTVARAVWVYNDISRRLIGAMKYADRSTDVDRYGKLLALAGRDVLREVNVIIPIPLHWRRLISRRYNQSAWLAYALSKHTQVPVDVTSLKRIRHTKPQARCDLKDRAKNIRRAFAVMHHERLRDKIIVLVDDVITTGATLEEATQVLLKAGAREVRVLTLAKTLREV
jgi:ComF family protein